MKTFKLFINVISYSSGSFYILNDLLNNELLNAMTVNKPLQDIATSLFIAILIVKLVWLIVDKWLEFKERSIKMDSDKEDLDHKRRKNLEQ